MAKNKIEKLRNKFGSKYSHVPTGTVILNEEMTEVLSNNWNPNYVIFLEETILKLKKKLKKKKNK